jgi:DNA (cytosine-5)-methyltransferase 1
MVNKHSQIRALDLFAGAGGSSAGAAAAGVAVVAAVDLWSLAKETYTSNFSEVTFLQEKCEHVSIAELKQTIGSIDLLLASPECTSHTCAKGNAPRSEASRRTAFQVIRFARAFRPRWIVVENVVHMRSWKSYPRWLEGIRRLGYKIREQVISAADHGVPQARRRLFVMCDLEAEPREVRGRRGRRKTAAGILERNGKYKFSPLVTTRRASATLERANRAISVVGNTTPFLLVYYGSDAAGGWQRVDVPLRTLTTLDRFAYVRPTTIGHEMRMLQPPELQAAMGFPSGYRLEIGTRRERIKLLGNAVCPPVLSAVIRTMTRAGETAHEES